MAGGVSAFQSYFLAFNVLLTPSSFIVAAGLDPAIQIHGPLPKSSDRAQR